ncbi:uncharacterized protein [Dysidea avara]|uniref:uncharacterized protein n=1 Tax=Dysidea avara TaxID=196820 RepID=UPI0033321429
MADEETAGPCKYEEETAQDTIPSKKARRDFGSFHSSNADELIRLSKEDYDPPVIPFSLPCYQSGDHADLFGAAIRKSQFCLSDKITFLNHGAFGCTLRSAMDVAQKWREYCETEPVSFIDRELIPHLVYVSRRLAEFVDCDPCDLVLVPNVTTAMNCILQSLARTMTSDDVILFFNVTYGATKKMLQYIKDLVGIQLDEVKLSFPISSAQQILEMFAACLKPNTKLVIIDHVSSNYGIILPVKELVEICHERGVLVLVDGAHALGILPISMRSFGADFYTTNCHKWFCGPKGTALMYISCQHHQAINPLVVSHGFQAGFNSKFIWTGLQDYSPFLALHTVLNFWQQTGVDEMRRYMFQLVRSAAALLQKSWGTDLLADVSLFGTMILVQLPADILGGGAPQITYDHAELIQNRLFHDHHIEVPIKALEGKLYVRISAHVYNELDQYSSLASAIVDIKSKRILL